ncbi:MAG TPA: chlorohydrolase family protein [Candidatus Methylomirabilis sp.]|nr:chlorohydrolase family protein [Candidatus Methylomirabilis sp.]
MTSTRRIAIRAAHIIAHDGRGHRHLRDGVVVIEGDRIVHVGPRFDGAVDETVDAADRVVTPGLISTHAHIGGSPLDRSFLEDRGNPQFWYSGLFEMLPVRHEAQDEEAGRACVDFSMAELLRGGVTTVMEIGGLGEHVVERAAHFGLRVYMGLAFRSGRWLTRDGRRVHWEWDEAAGRKGLERAVEFHRKHDGAHGDLVRCFFAPAQIDTCTPELLKEAKRCADEVRRPYQVHTSQSVVEFNEMLARHGKTPVAWMHELGVLGPTTILGHAIIVGGSSWTNYPAGDVALMGDTGCSVAHAVWVFARRGVAMESFARYKQAGVNMSLGTDTNPQSVIEAMRWAAVVSKLMERNTEATTAADVFDAATVGGARALGRDDLGRIAPGAKADLVLWKATSWRMTPLRDPIKNIVYNAADEDIDRVYVNGRVVVDGGRVLAADEAAILKALQAGGERMWPRMAKHDWAGRGSDELSPPSYPAWA